MVDDSAEAGLVAMAQAGDQQAFGELVIRRQSLIRGLLRRLSGDSSLGDDLAQEAFVVAWQKLPQLRDQGRFGAWLRQVAVTIWLQHARRRKILFEPLDHAEPVRSSVREHPVERLTLENALQQLPAAERLCLLLAYHEGMSHTEIVAATGLALGTVKSHIARGASKLRASLGAS